MSKYINFELNITSSGDKYDVYARSEIDGKTEQKRIDFVLPFNDDELKEFVKLIDKYRGIQRGKQRSASTAMDQDDAVEDTSEIQDDAQRGASTPVVRELDPIEDSSTLDRINLEIELFGGKLFASVFASDIRLLYKKSLDEASKDNDERVRVRLILEDSDLAHLPWEFLYDKDQGFVSQSKDSPIVRYVRPRRAVSEITHIKPPINIVVLISSPEHPGLAKLNVEKEWQKLKKAVGKLEREGSVNLIRVEAEPEESQRDALRTVLQQTECHIIHYIGHGLFNQRSQTSELVWEDKDGQSDRLKWRDIRRMFGDENSVRLIVLNSCEGAKAVGDNPFSGIAQQLAQMWVPAVVAMQFEITDQAAIKFSAEFYQALIGAQYTIESAVTEGRKAIADDKNLTEWATPVLYSHVSNSQLFPSTEPLPSQPPDRPNFLKKISVPLQKIQQQIGAWFAKTPKIARWVALAVLLLIPIGFGVIYLSNKNPMNSPTAAVNTYFDLVSDNQCEQSWDYLSPEYRLRRHQNSSTSYREWCESIEDADIKSTNMHTQIDNNAKVDALIGFNQGASEYLFNFELIRDQSAGFWQKKWQIDRSNGRQLKQIPIPAGSFLRGSEADDAFADEKPEHNVYLDTYNIDQTEVSNQEFALFVAKTKYETTAEKAGESLIRTGVDQKLVEGLFWAVPSEGRTWEAYPTYPVVHTSWEDANAFCAWRGKRLPTEAEWEKAARWDDTNQQALTYPWGDEFDGKRLNYCDSNCPFSWKDGRFNDRFSQSAPVGSYPSGASPYGVLDMAGNAVEWVNDWEGSYDKTQHNNPQGAVSGDDKVLRGGSWASSESGRSINTTSRIERVPTYSSRGVGFRCAQDG